MSRERLEYLRKKKRLAELKAKRGGRVSGAGIQKMTDPNAPNVIQEMHPQFSSVDRFVAKTGSKDPEASLAYYAQENPNLEFKQYAGQILMRTKGSKDDWNVADPSGITSPMEAVRDMGDVAYDVGAGMLTAGAGALGGLVGLATGPGSLATASAAAGATGGGLEYLRQKLGQHMGIPQEPSLKDAATVGGISAFFPGLAGTGVKEGGKMLAKQAAKKGVPLATAQEAQKGVVSRALPKVSSALSGVPEEAVKAQAKYGPQLRNATEETATDIAEKTHAQLKEGFAVKKQAIGEKLAKEIDSTGELVNIAPAKTELKTRIKTLESGIQNKQTKAKIADLQNQYDELFLEEVDVKKLVPKQSGIVDELGNPIASGFEEVTEKTMRELPDEIPASKAFNLKQDLDDYAETWRFQKDTMGSRFTPTQSPADRLKLEASRRGSKSINKQLGEATEGKSRELQKQYGEYAQMQKDIQSKFASPERTHKTLSNLYGQNKDIVRTQIKRAQTATGVDLKKSADQLSALKFYRSPSMLPVSGGGSTSSTRTGVAGVIGGAFGAKLGLATGLGPWAGATLGAGAANVAASPWATKGYMGTYNLMGKGAKALQLDKPPAWMRRGAPISAWQAVRDR